MACSSDMLEPSDLLGLPLPALPACQPALAAALTAAGLVTEPVA